MLTILYTLKGILKTTGWRVKLRVLITIFMKIDIIFHQKNEVSALNGTIGLP